jgi:UDP-N-acetylglucosamine 2-epimerase
MRDTTERPEVLDAGCAKLVGTDTTNIVNEARVLMSDVAAYAEMSSKPNPFGDGRAAQKIADLLL